MPVDLLVKLMGAMIVSFAASVLLLRRWRDEMAAHVDGTVQRRRARRERLRTALAGDDSPVPPSGDVVDSEAVAR